MNLVFQFIDFFWEKITSSDWYFIPIFVLGLVLCLFFILFLSVWLITAMWAVITLILSYFQRLAGIKLPMIGSKLEESLRASEKRISQEAKNMWRHNVHNAVAYFKYKSEDGVVISDEELQILRQILRQSRNKGTSIFDALHEYEKLSDEDKKYFKQQYYKGELDSWMNNVKYELRPYHEKL